MRTRLDGLNLGLLVGAVVALALTIESLRLT